MRFEAWGTKLLLITQLSDFSMKHDEAGWHAELRDSHSRKRVRTFVAILACTAMSAAAASGIDDGEDAAFPSARLPRQWFTQVGVAGSARAATVGATWSSTWQRDFASGRGSVYWEASFGRWISELEDGGKSASWVTQLGITPVLRWQPHAWNEHWFVEAGIGANVLLPIYRSRDKRFSTTFNFGDHIALGRSFGMSDRHELSLRIQHFSNAGIKRPNPGENFLQLRYAWRY